MTDNTLSRKLFGMFVSVAVDPGSEERARELADLLAQYGFEKVQRGLWESAIVAPATLDRLKRDLDRATDAYDRLRLFQFPVDGTLVLTSLREKKWRRMVARSSSAENAEGRGAAQAPRGAEQAPRGAAQAPRGAETAHSRTKIVHTRTKPHDGRKNN